MTEIRDPSIPHASDAAPGAPFLYPEVLPGENMSTIGIILFGIGILIFLGSLLIETSVEVPALDQLGYGSGGRVGNIPGQHTQLMVALGGSLLTIFGTLIYGFGAVIKQLATGQKQSAKS